ncbi:VOC family protein [Streptomyces avicenniae]|uniref:VOC family protein n=1 Tax=Streptomyces avicenniae TaxID=500153 RepID=UPI00069A1A9D|nr:VOC family protein [Streptomyces avicenniae]
MIGFVQCVVLDCPDVHRLARFYHGLLGGEVNRPDPRWSVDDDFATLHLPGDSVLAFQRVADHRPPRWPDSAHPQQFHLDIEVTDLDAARERALAEGASPLHEDARGWLVLADPAGHPFCLLPGPGAA